MLVALLASDPLLDWSVGQWRSEPEIRIEDAYKWLFQATLGGEHAVHDQKMAADWLSGEWRGLGKPRKNEPLSISLTPDGRLIRLNLRPYRATGGTEKSVLRMFVQSAHQFHGDRSTFVREWSALGDRLHSVPIGHLSFAEWTRLDHSVRGKGYPAIDHSTAYEAAYHPAYRVVLGQFFPVIGRTERAPRMPHR